MYLIGKIRRGEMEYKNYSTVNETENAENKKWCISAKMLKTLQQATITLNDNRIDSTFWLHTFYQQIWQRELL